MRLRPPGGLRLDRFEESLLAGGVVAAAPVAPALSGAPARDHLDGAGRAGGRHEVALGREPVERARLFRHQRGDLPGKVGAIDQPDALAAGEVARFLRELARGHDHAFADIVRRHRAAQRAHRLDADAVRGPRPALHEDAGVPGALLVQVDGDAAGARAGKVRPKPDLLEIGRAKLLEAPPLEPLQELRRALGVVELRAPGVRAEEAPGDAAERGAGGGGGFRGEGERMRERRERAEGDREQQVSWRHRRY